LRVLLVSWRSELREALSPRPRPRPFPRALRPVPADRRKRRRVGGLGPASRRSLPAPAAVANLDARSAQRRHQTPTPQAAQGRGAAAYPRV